MITGLVAAGSGPGRGTPAAAEAAPATATATAGDAADDLTVSPLQVVTKLLKRQGAALLAGDQPGWLAPVDPSRPALLARFRMLYTSLRALDVSQFLYAPHLLSQPANPVIEVDSDISYCFSMGPCPNYGTGGNDAPRVRLTLTLETVGGRLLITSLGPPDEPDPLEPTPWEYTALSFRQGRRVTVAAVPSQAKYMATVLGIAEQAAKVDDRFARYVQNPQTRYRIYLADDHAWQNWYGGEPDKGTIGYAIQLNADGTDVVLNMRALSTDHTLLATTIKHEMGHVVTMSGVNVRGEDDMWLTEGIAEYIGWSPLPATSSWRRPSVRAAVHGSRRPTSIALPPPSPDASARTFDAFYGLGHFAVECLAHRYGEPALFDFIRFRLQDGFENDDSSRRAFGRPFAVVDQACVAWIRKTA